MASQLTEMGINLIRAMDYSKRQIVSIEEDKKNWKIVYKNSTSVPLIINDELESTMMGDAIVIVANTRENVSVLIENWSLAIKYSKLIVIFLDAVSGTKWILRPLIHDKIAEPKMLAKGILSLFQQSTVS